MVEELSKFVRPKEPIKYFAIDVDGTFYSYDPKIQLENYKTFGKMKSLGCTPFFCTGRIVNSIMTLMGPEIVNISGHNGYPGVYVNGAIVYDDKGNIISCTSFNSNIVECIYNNMKENNKLDMIILLDKDNFYILTELSDMIYKYIKDDKHPDPIKININELLQLNILCIVIFDINIKFNNLNENIDYISKIANTHEFIMLSPPGITKCNGIQILMKHYGQDPSTCGFIGDSHNDLEAAILSNYSFTVGNAEDFIKSNSKYFTNTTCNQGAFTEIINHVYNFTK